MKGIGRIILGIVFLYSPALTAEDLCVARLSVIEGAGITTMDASKLVQASAKLSAEDVKDAASDVQTPSTTGPMIDYADGQDDETLVDRGDAPLKSGVIQYGDQEHGAGPLVDYGDKGAEPNGAGPLVFRGDRGPIDLDGPSDSGDSSPFDALIGTAMGGDPEMAKALKLTPRQDGYQFTFENLVLNVMQTPPPKSMKEALAGIEPKAGDAHLRIDSAKEKGAPCVPASWDGSALKLKADSGNRLVLQFSNAKLVKKASKKTRRVFAFQGPMQLGLEKRK